MPQRFADGTAKTTFVTRRQQRAQRRPLQAQLQPARRPPSQPPFLPRRRRSSAAPANVSKTLCISVKAAYRVQQTRTKRCRFTDKRNALHKQPAAKHKRSAPIPRRMQEGARHAWTGRTNRLGCTERLNA